MADLWVKMRYKLRELPETLRMAKLLGHRKNLRLVIGSLQYVWSWAQKYGTFVPGETVGSVPGGDADMLDDVAEQDGMAAAMADVGWLVVHDDRLEFPKFDVYLSGPARTKADHQQKTAHSRAQKRAQSAHNCAPLDGDVDGDGETGTRKSPLRSGRSGRDGEKDKESGEEIPDIEWHDVLRRVLQATATDKIVKCKTDQDRALLLKSCALIGRGKVTESMVCESLEAVKVNKARNSPAYFHTTLQNLVKDAGGNLHREMARITVPEDVIRLRGEYAQ